MKWIRKSIVLTLLTGFLLTAAPKPEAKGAILIAEIIRQGIIWVIKAVNLMVQRLQNETLWLQNAAKVIENKLSQFKLNEIAEWTDRQRQLYQKYYDDLWKIRTTLAAYHRIATIVNRQQQIVQLYSQTWRLVSSDDHFSSTEIDYMYRVYSGILNDSIYNLEQVILVINSYRLQMSDAKRKEAIDKAAENVEKNYRDMKQFHNQNMQLSMSRAKDKHEVETIRRLYGLPTE
ncbi:MAG: conjugal transfer protein TraI [Cyclobacteriaceae bacterium]|nr:conjugal transfer protein TraI [Cyclobacteriaceae bacterium]